MDGIYDVIIYCSQLKKAVEWLPLFVSRTTQNV
jgi:hypothetical protein